MENIRPFLYNLFSDPAIIKLPALLRKPLAKFISWRRAKGAAKEIYQQLGGKSPLLEQTQAQAQALEAALGEGYKLFVCMRYWHPMSDSVARNVKAWEPERIVLLPLYPQYSTTTTASSLADWKRVADKIGLAAPTTTLCCYPTEQRFVAAHIKLIKDAYWKASEHGKPRILFSAHGIPERIAATGDPYGWQVKETAAAVVRLMAMDDIDYTVCYQSRVGPLKWLAPYVEDEITRAAKDGVPVVAVPVSFVSEHSETLIDLDIKYRELAEKEGVPGYQRVPALSCDPLFIESLAELCKAAVKSDGICSSAGARLCPRQFAQCPCYA